MQVQVDIEGDLPVVEELFHGHSRHNRTSLSFYDAFNDLLYVVAAWCDQATLTSRWQLAIAVSCQENCIFHKARFLIVRSDGEHCRKGKLQLLACHGLKRHGKIEGCNAELRDLLKRIDEGLLADANFLDTSAGNGEVRVRFGDVIPHGCGQ